jgi:hypothetical protein
MRTTLITLTALALLGGACSDGTGPDNPGSGRIQLSIAVRSSPLAGAALTAENYTLGGTTLVLTRVQIVLREIELKRTEGSTTCVDDDQFDDSPSGSKSQDDQSQDGESEDHCEKFVTGPVLLDLPLNGAMDQVVTIDADTGTYRELEFEVHKPADGGPSIRVEGTWNGTPFVYTTDLNAEQEVGLVPPLVITAAGQTALTLKIDLRTWFLNGGGTAFVDPATANSGQPSENLVKDNIRRSFDAFEDDDHDGERDDD